MNAWQITRKDLLLLFRDKRALITLVALPILLITVVGLSTGKLFDWKTRSESYTLAIVDLAETDASRRLVERIEKLDAVDPTRVSSARTAKEFVDSERTDACLVIGLNFPERVAALKLRDVFRLEDGRLREGLPSLDITFDGGGRDVAPLVSRLLWKTARRTTRIRRPRRQRLRAAKKRSDPAAGFISSPYRPTPCCLFSS